MLGGRRAARTVLDLSVAGAIPRPERSRTALQPERAERTGNQRRERRVAQNGSEAGPLVAGVAGRYASALFELARDERQVDAVASSLNQFDTLLNESADLRRLV